MLDGGALIDGRHMLHHTKRLIANYEDGIGRYREAEAADVSAAREMGVSVQNNYWHRRYRAEEVLRAARRVRDALIDVIGDDDVPVGPDVIEPTGPAPAAEEVDVQAEKQMASL